MASILSIIGWSVVPNYVTSVLQNVYYGITIRAGDPRPQPGTPRFDKHRRRIFISVIITYLFYSIYESFHQIRTAGDYYSALGVSPLADERTIKSRFRRLAAQHHPDKLGQQQLPNAAASAEGLFVYLKLAQDTLLDPARRYAYDRFGPQVNDWQNTRTMQDFLYAGLRQISVQSIAGLSTIAVLNLVYWSPWGRYWRFYTIAALIALELVLVTQPSALIIPSDYLPSILVRWIGLSHKNTPSALYVLPYQVVSLARRVSITVHIFISQITQFYVSPAETTATKENRTGLAPQTLQRLDQLAQLSRATDREASRLLELSLSPFRGDGESVATLRRGMKEGLVVGSVRNTPEVREAVAQAQRRRAGDS